MKVKNRTNLSSEAIDLAIIGAGPYGLSIAAHLNARGVPFRIFGSPMSVWSSRMPRGMRLKSEGFASSLSHPDARFTLREYCREQGIPYADAGDPVRIETFVAYGLEFQKRFVPNLEDRLVASLRQSGDIFELLLQDGERVFARRVILAVGIAYYAWLPPVLAGLPSELVSHSSAHSDLSGFRDRHVVVVGAGASALDVAGLLHSAGASVDLIARAPAIRFQEPPRPRSWAERLRYPRTGIGSGADMVFYAHFPHWFRHLPERLRLNRVKKILGAAPGWFSKQDVVGKVAFHLNREIASARAQEGRVVLEMTDSRGNLQIMDADHVIAATGYRVDLGRIEFLTPALREQIRTTGSAPALSAMFESSVPGLYFVGVSAANSFGPLMRFAFGSGFTARRLSKHLARAVGLSASSTAASLGSAGSGPRSHPEVSVRTDAPIS